jgi:hypothetical protein
MRTGRIPPSPWPSAAQCDARDFVSTAPGRGNRFGRSGAVVWLLVWAAIAPVFAAEVDVSGLPPPATNTTVFDRDIRPIFERSCIRCHGAEKPKSRFRLDNRESALKGGEQGIAIKPGQSAESPLIHYVAGLVEDMEMPPMGKGDPLTSEQIAMLRAWIDQGVPWGEAATVTRSYMMVSPMVQWISVDGHKNTFREQQWRREGLTAGVDGFEIREVIDERSRVLVSGRALRDEFRVSLTVERDDVGFIRAGAEEFHKFSSDAGGYYPSFSPPVNAFGQDLRLDVGRAWFDVGLTLPDLPRVVVGYEYQYREGSKSTLQWGDETDGSVIKKVRPAIKEIDEDVHILKVDVSHTIGGLFVEDNFRGEFYELGTSRRNFTSFAPGALPPGDQRIDERQSYFHGANILRVEKQFTDWLLGAAGYLYSRLDSDAAFQQDTTILSFNWHTSGGMVLDRDSHVVNVNGLLGPWHGLSLAVGAQAEWMRQEGMGRGIEFLSAFAETNLPMFNTDIDRATVEETARLRYTGLPFTTLFAEARLQQESIGQYEASFGPSIPGGNDFLRDTDASTDVRDWRVGFSTSPWTRASATAHFRQHQRLASYNHVLDDDTNGLPYDGYPAFIRSREVCTDEVEARLTLRAARWLKTTLGYKYVTTDFWTETDAEPSAAMSPGGWILAGNQRAHIYSLGAVVTPLRRLYWSTTLAYHDTSTTTGDNDTEVVVPYRGHVYNALSSATFALSERMDLHAAYTFSYADYGQDNFATGLPLGLEFRRHGIEAGVTRRWLKTVSTRLQYAFYKYDEPSSGRFTDYTAHAVFATVNLRWP